ncbi:hypothetical protein V6Z11_A02G093100 [Gossypium hirsutum]
MSHKCNIKLNTLQHTNISRCMDLISTFPYLSNLSQGLNAQITKHESEYSQSYGMSTISNGFKKLQGQNIHNYTFLIVDLMHIISIHIHQFTSQTCTQCILIEFTLNFTLSARIMLIEPSHIRPHMCALKSIYHIQIFTHYLS